MVEVAQRGERLLDDVVAGLAAHGGDERDAAGVVLVGAVVEADGLGPGREAAEGRDHGAPWSSRSRPSRRRKSPGGPEGSPPRRDADGPRGVSVTVSAAPCRRERQPPRECPIGACASSSRRLPDRRRPASCADPCCRAACPTSGSNCPSRRCLAHCRGVRPPVPLVSCPGGRAPVPGSRPGCRASCSPVDPDDGARRRAVVRLAGAPGPRRCRRPVRPRCRPPAWPARPRCRASRIAARPRCQRRRRPC